LNTLTQKQEELKSANIQSVIYKIENVINGKVYIGKSKNIANRLGQYKYYMKVKSSPNMHLIASIEKYGIENFTFSIIEEIDETLLNEREIYWIKYYDSTDRKRGYNKTFGGDGMRATLEIRLKISNSLLNVKHSDERRKNSSLSKLGVKHSPEHNKNIGKAQNVRYKDPDEREKQGIALRKSVYQYNLNGNFIKEWDSVVNASKELNIHASIISKSIRGYENRKSAGGYLWSYELLEKHLGSNGQDSKPIVQYDLNNDFIAEFDSIGNAARILSIDKSGIIKCCKGKQTRCGGFIFEYK